MNFRYDGEADMAYLQLVELEPVEAASTVVIEDDELPSDIAIDLDAEGRILGIEIFSAARALHRSMLGPR